MSKKHTISLIIIAKNEAKGLEKAISSCRDFVDEVIVGVDSNSTDNTLEIANKFADRAIMYDWKDSFASARNNIQKYAKSEWVLHLDGHEYVENHEKLNEMLSKNVEALFIKIILESGFNFYYPRIIKQNIKWQHDVHNTPASKRNMRYDEFVIIHDRENYQSEQGKKIRSEQREQMITSQLGADLKKNKNNIRANFYTGNLYLDQKRYKQAIPYYLKVIKFTERKSQKWLARLNLGICYNNLGKPRRALWHFYKAEKAQPNRWEIAKMKGTTYALLGWHKKAIQHWVDSFKINTGQFMFCPLPRNDAETWDFISLTFAILGQMEKSTIAALQALKEEMDNGPGLLPAEKIKILEAITGQKNTPTKSNTIIEVCFLVYQRPERVPILLEQLKNQTIQNFKVNIWNNSDKILDIKSYPQDKIQIINSKTNIGSQARFKLAKKTTGNPIIFFDDDQDLDPNFIKYNYEQYLKFGKKCILGWFTRTFHQEKYWQGTLSQYGNEVDYIATKAMILDREIIDKEPLLQNIPDEFARVEDLYLCYLARMKYNTPLLQIGRYTSEKPDGKDQYPTIDKEKAFSQLRENGWWILKDQIRTYGKLRFKIRNKQWDAQILHGETDPKYYKIPKNPKVVVDIGAHIGGTSILCASMGAEVYAYEPEESNFGLLEINVANNFYENKIHCIKKGVGNPGKRTIYLNPENSGMATFEKISGYQQEIEIISAKEVFENIPHCDLLKMDCEGAEYEFLFDLPFEKIDQISMELHKGEQQKIINHLKKIYEVEVKPAIDGTSLMVFCIKKI